MNLTRESALWWVGLISAVAAGLAALDTSAAAALGLPVAILPYLRLYAMIAGIGSAWAKTSPYPSKDDPPAGSVSVSKLPPAAMILLACVLGAGVVTSTSCAGNAPPTITPGALSAVKAAEVVKALDAARDIAQVVQQAYPAVVTPADWQKVLTTHQALVTIIGASPNGWKPTAQAGLDQLQKDLSPAAAARLGPYLAFARALVDAFVPVTQ